MNFGSALVIDMDELSLYTASNGSLPVVDQLGRLQIPATGSRRTPSTTTVDYQ